MLKKQVHSGLAWLLILTTAVWASYGVLVYAHHNSPMYDVIEENENFDNMDMHEAAIESIPDNSSMDTGATQGTYSDVSEQTGSMDGPSGMTDQNRMQQE